MLDRSNEFYEKFNQVEASKWRKYKITGESETIPEWRTLTLHKIQTFGGLTTITGYLRHDVSYGINP